MRGGWGRKAARCGLPRFLRPLGRSQCLRGWGALGREGHAALCSMPRFLRPLGRSQRLRRAGGWGVGACRALRHASFLAAFGPLAKLAGWGAGGGREGHAALCGIPRFLRPLGRSQRLRGGVRWGVGACRVLRHAAFLAALGRSQRLLFVLRHRDLGRCPKPRQGPEAPAPRSFPLHPTLSPLLPYLTTRFLSLLISSVTPSGGSPNVALSVLLPPSHVSCIAISRASIRQPSSTTVTTSPTS